MCKRSDCWLRLDVFCCRCEVDGLVLLPCSGVKYGFTLAVLEGPNTIPTLWDATQDFMGEIASPSTAYPKTHDHIICA